MPTPIEERLEMHRAALSGLSDDLHRVLQARIESGAQLSDPDIQHLAWQRAHVDGAIAALRHALLDWMPRSP